MSENDANESAPEGQETNQETSLSQSEVDKIMAKVRSEERRKASEKYKDYDELKAKAGEKQTLEERIAEMEQQANQAQVKALRSDIAAEFKISKEDRDLFLNASDEDTLRAQAKRLTERDAEQLNNGNVVPREGSTPSNAFSGDDVAFANFLTGHG